MIEAPIFFNMQYTQEGGVLTPNSFLYNDQVSQFLGTIGNYFNQAIPFPSFTTVQLTALDFPNNDGIVPGSVWFDSTLGKLYLKTGAGTQEQIQSA